MQQDDVGHPGGDVAVFIGCTCRLGVRPRVLSPLLNGPYSGMLPNAANGVPGSWPALVGGLPSLIRGPQILCIFSCMSMKYY